MIAPTSSFEESMTASAPISSAFSRREGITSTTTMWLAPLGR
ncbi:hypothetical protein [Microbacterium sp. zg.Y1084]|nr:hypothetical protein [Microbacterium sp. zg.Y1084]MCR2812900.1 hypothetical protein [Microbacterium sp. zg.Y1084]